MTELPAELVAELAVAYNAARERIDNGTAREDTRKSGEGVGLLGDATSPRAGMQGAVSYRDIEGSRAETLMARQQQNRDAEAERLTWLRGASRSGYEQLAGEAGATTRQTNRQYAGNGGLFR